MNQVCTDLDLVRQNLEVQIQVSPKRQHNIWIQVEILEK